jgi:hypothetical protein
MADPQRLLDDPSASPLGRSLLEAAGDDAPSSEGRARTARRLGIVAFASSTVAGGSGTAAILTVAAVVVGLGAVVAVAVSSRDSSQDTPPPPEPPRVTSHAPAPAPIPTPDPPKLEVAPPAPPPAVEPKPEPKPEPKIDAKAEPKPLPAKTPPKVEPAPKPEAPASVEPAPPPPVEAPPVQAPPVEKPVQVDPRLLAAEVALLDRARTQLAHGDAAGALATLDDHDRQFGNGALTAESTVVRIDTLAHLGRSQQARQLGNDFLSRFPRSPLAHRVRTILDSLQ